MPGGRRDQLKHLLIQGSSSPEAYTYPKDVRGSSHRLPPRDRAEHGAHLLAELEAARRSQQDLSEQRRAVGIAEDRGIYLEFESNPGFDLSLESLDRTREGIELVAVRERDDVMFATAFVAEGKFQKFEKLVSTYLEEDGARSDRPKNQKLVESISGLRAAALESFWTDDFDNVPIAGISIWWEVWLRVGNDRRELDATFVEHATRAGIRILDRRIEFADRTVLLAYGTREQMSRSVVLLDCVAELRSAKERPEFFTALEAREQADWVDDLLARVERPEVDAPAVCILDTGVNNGHPLLRESLVDQDVLTCNPSWGAKDHHSHGTEMAGLALFGDLVDSLSHNGPVAVEHCLESVKILPPPNLPPNKPLLYGSVTQEAMGRIEIQQPRRKRVFCMAVTATDFRDRGRPSSWSAAVDAACYGVVDDHARLVVLAAGNVDRANWQHYPERNDIDQIHDPGQAWNALTVGAVTDKVQFDTAQFPGWAPLARPGGLSPSSTTSVAWQSPWPYKPDFVMEGGNGIRQPRTGLADTDDPLLLLTTHWRPTERAFTTMGDTSAATAQAARMAAMLFARYPTFWPETIRALMVHSARWTNEMLKSTEGLSSAARAIRLLRRYGYGVPDFGRACWSASNVLTLVAQDSLTPFMKRKSDSRVVTKDMNLHALPWPRNELLALGSQIVELQVTLSYFVEPSPSRRGWKYRHCYQSHALRFEIKAALEDLDSFRARVSRDAQVDEGKVETPADPGWEIGKNQRNRGSIHSDRWIGTAADLAERGHLIVYPVSGWWKERPNLERWRRPVRYSLIVTIRTPGAEVDIYTPIANQVAITMH